MQAKRKNKIEEFKQILDDIKTTNDKFDLLVYEKEKFEKMNSQNEELQEKMNNLMSSSQYESLLNHAKTGFQPQPTIISNNLLQPAA